MVRLVKDRYVAYDDVRGCDLATGTDVRLDRLSDDIGLGDFPALVEVFRDSRDAYPRWIVASASTQAQAAVIARRAAAHACLHGFVPILGRCYLQFRDALADDLDERSLLLIGSGAEMDAARAALVDAASRAPRSHVLLTFRTDSSPHVRSVRLPPSHRLRRTAVALAEAGQPDQPVVVREARAAYQPAMVDRRHDARQIGSPAAVPSDVARHIERAARAREFVRLGRHAAAERLLRDVAGALTRRRAWAPAGEVLITLGRLLLERGRSGPAEKVFEEAAQLAGSTHAGRLVTDARLWHAAARTDSSRLSAAESICRAVLLAGCAPTTQQTWATAMLARILWWQGRVDEALGLDMPPCDWTLFEGEASIAAWIDATAVRILLAGGRIFDAGQRARMLVAQSEQLDEPLPRLIALTAHLRVLASAGDLYLARQQLAQISTLARACRAPLRAARARMVWLDALRASGRTREARVELDRIGRLRRAAPALLRRAIEERMAQPPQSPPVVGASTPFTRLAGQWSLACALVELTHVEDDDEAAVRRLLDRVTSELSPTRIDLVSADAGPVTTVLTVGNGMATSIGGRILEAGIVIREDGAAGGMKSEYRSGSEGVCSQASCVAGR